jgi:hypothetical protein
VESEAPEIPTEILEQTIDFAAKAGKRVPWHLSLLGLRGWCGCGFGHVQILLMELDCRLIQPATPIRIDLAQLSSGLGWLSVPRQGSEVPACPSLVSLLDAAHNRRARSGGRETSRLERRWLIGSIIDGIASPTVTFWRQAAIR